MWKGITQEGVIAQLIWYVPQTDYAETEPSDWLFSICCFHLLAGNPSSPESSELEHHENSHSFQWMVRFVPSTEAEQQQETREGKEGGTTAGDKTREGKEDGMASAWIYPGCSRLELVCCLPIIILNTLCPRFSFNAPPILPLHPNQQLHKLTHTHFAHHDIRFR